GRAGRLGAVMTAVVVDGLKGKEYRLPTERELRAAEVSKAELDGLFSEIPFGLPPAPTPRHGPGAARAFSVDHYVLDTWEKLFTPRQLSSIETLIKCVREMPLKTAKGVLDNYSEAIFSMMRVDLDRAINYMSTICIWEVKAQEIKQTFLRYALPIT